MSEHKPTILVTGGAGFIGSHTVLCLLEQGYRTIVVDNLSNSNKKVFERIEQIAGAEACSNLSFYECDVRDRDALAEIFETNSIDAVIHFAGYKAVGESVKKPIEYYQNNLDATFSLVDTMRESNCKSIIFSSSATVYGDPDSLPLTEESPKKLATNPYGWTKWMIEQILADIVVADPEWNVVILRYFNPIGAHPTGLMGEDPKGIPNNLVPYVSQVAVGRRDEVHVYGDDYPTPDGTGKRDYIHVMDLAEGHVAALKWMKDGSGYEVFNLGTGTSTSVLEVIRAYEHAYGHEIAYVVDPRRPGDIAENYADATKAKTQLGWEAQYDIADMCRDAWTWQSQNPNGYSE